MTYFQGSSLSFSSPPLQSAAATTHKLKMMHPSTLLASITTNINENHDKDIKYWTKKIRVLAEPIHLMDHDSQILFTLIAALGNYLIVIKYTLLSSFMFVKHIPITTSTTTTTKAKNSR